MTPQEMITMLDRLGKSVLKNKSDSMRTKYQVKSLFEYLKKLVLYQVPMPPIDVSEDGLEFSCPRCKQMFRGGCELDTVDIFYFCPSCGQRFKEGKPSAIDEEGVENETN